MSITSSWVCLGYAAPYLPVGVDVQLSIDGNGSDFLYARLPKCTLRSGVRCFSNEPSAICLYVDPACASKSSTRKQLDQSAKSSWRCETEDGISDVEVTMGLHGQQVTVNMMADNDDCARVGGTSTAKLRRRC